MVVEFTENSRDNNDQVRRGATPDFGTTAIRCRPAGATSSRIAPCPKSSHE
jgi:hypothetical protein